MIEYLFSFLEPLAYMPTLGGEHKQLNYLVTDWDSAVTDHWQH